MSVSYDVFTHDFLSKLHEYDFITMGEDERTEIVDGYMKHALSRFNRICEYDLMSIDDEVRELLCDIPEDKLIEISDIVSEGMLVGWMKPYVYKQENYELLLNTVDYTGYSPAELLRRISAAYVECKRDFENMIKEYSYNHGDLSELHL